jgi:hypothetical protein
MSTRLNQNGFVPVIVLVLLIVGLGVALTLVKNPTNLSPKAAAPANNNDSVGNGALSGTHYNLNLIGVPKNKTVDMTSGQGHRIFMPLEGKCKVNLVTGDFQVLDGNCTDGLSSFRLPNPDPDNNGATEYSVYARALGKPGGKSTSTSCATDPTTGEIYCSVYSMVMSQEKGQSSFTDVSKLLLYVYADINGDGTVERYPLFDNALQDYYWSYDNNGLKLVQLRFYPVSSNVN